VIPASERRPEALAPVARGFAGRRCLVVGDALLDVFEEGRAVKLAPDAPVPVLKDVRRTSSPGGAANVAANLAALGAEVSLVSAIGEDGAADELLGALQSAGVRTAGVVRVRGRETVVKRRIVADGTALARLDSGDTDPLAEGVARRLARAAADLAGGAEAVIVSDYSGGSVGAGIPTALKGHGLVVLDSKEPLRLRWEGLAAATPNHLEAQRALGLAPEPDPARLDAEALARVLRERLGVRLLALTLAEAGVWLAEGDGPGKRIPGRAVREAHPNGAGDTFLSAFSLALCCGAAPEGAARLGVEAATLSVARPGTAPVGLAELLERLSKNRCAGLEEKAERVRRSGGRVVLVVGHLDPRSPEDVQALRRARELGDLLVAVPRPGREESHSRQDALMLLEELRSVDHVATPSGVFDLVGRLSPDVCVLAGVHAPEDRAIAEAVMARGGEVVFDARLSEGAAPQPNGGRPNGRHEARDVPPVEATL